MIFAMQLNSVDAIQVSSQREVDTGIQAYDVVSIKEDRSDSGALTYRLNQDGFELANAPLSVLLSMAYGIRDRRIVGIPSWAKEERFDVKAKCLQPDLIGHTGLSDMLRKAMMLSLLKMRFGLATHQAQQVLPVYALQAEKGGMHLKPSIPNEPVSLVVNRGEASATATSLSSFADALSGILDRDVINEISGDAKYDINIRWNPSEMHTDLDTVSQEAEFPSIFSAMKVELGLRLAPAMEPIAVVVVDEVHRPTPD